jgi:type IV secretory pathway VirJ component
MLYFSGKLFKMKKVFIFIFALLLLSVKSNAISIDSMVYGVFGKITIYRPVKDPEAVVLFVSGDGGWNKGVVDMAVNLVPQGALVVGINIQSYFRRIKTIKAKCYYPASDFESLSLTIQKKYKLKEYLKPILVGYSSGATLVYGILAQSPANTFKGAISLGFCPDIEIDRPLCGGSGLVSHVLKEGKSYYIESNTHLSAPFIILMGMLDQVCSYPDTKKYTDNMSNTELVTLPKVGHGFSVTKNWLPQFISAYKKILLEKGYTEKIAAENKIQQAQNNAPFISDLPLIAYPSTVNEKLPLAFFISGDGGWTNFDQSVCMKLSEKGMPVVGLDAQKFFWNEKQPKETADDIIKAVNHYMQQWNKSSFVLIGYSFGASIVPFIASNFSISVKENLKGLYCFSPDETGDFEIHITDMLNFSNKEKYDVLSELKKNSRITTLCVFGSEEDGEIKKHFSESGIKVEILPGSHHYDNNYDAVSGIIINNLISKSGSIPND